MCTYYLTDHRVISYVAVQQRQGGRGTCEGNIVVGAYNAYKKVKIDLIGDRRVLKKEAIVVLVSP
jgi:hypothetical protein